MLAILLPILKPLLPMLVGPLVTAAAKWLVSQFAAKIPAAWVPVVSGAAGAVTAVLAGDVSTVVTTATSAVTGAAAGFGGSKARDVLVGKAGACDPKDAVEAAIGMEGPTVEQ